MSVLRTYIRELLIESFQSHSLEPAVGDPVMNVNPNCRHRGSEGIVLAVEDLPSDQGRTVSYRCTNDGPTWDIGDVLIKTLDQLIPMEKAQ